MCLLPCCKTRAEKSLNKDEKDICLSEFLRSKSFPLTIYISFIVIGICCGITAVAFQVVSIVFESPFFYVCTG